MATYKVIQDIEAEDKLVGPLSLKQFIYACLAAVSGYVGFICVAKGAAFLLVVFLPITLFGVFFAFPWGRDQPTEIWALAKIRFFLKPRLRIWDQSGTKELVNITAPKKIERVLTNNLTRTQVESRLTALASTLDSRGWAIKNVNINLDAGNTAPIPDDSDRLVGPSAIPRQVSPVDITAGDDMLDEQNNPRAYQLSQLVDNSEQSHRKRIMEAMQRPAGAALPPVVKPTAPSVKSAQPQLPSPAASQWFTDKPLNLAPTNPVTNVPPPFAPGAAAPMVPQAAEPIIPPVTAASPSIPQAAEPTAEEEALVEALKRQKEKWQQTSSYQHMKTIQPLGQGSDEAIQPQLAPVQAPASVTPPPNPATIELAHRNDLTVATIANIANKQDAHPDEVVIHLH